MDWKIELMWTKFKEVVNSGVNCVVLGEFEEE